MQLRIVLLLLLTFTKNINAQETLELLSERQLKRAKVYTNLEKALKNPEKVIVLDLRGQYLDSIPANIGQFKNLQVIKLGWKIKKSTSKILVWKSKRIGGGILHLDRFQGKYVDYNHITILPEEIKQLSKLQQISMPYNNLTEVPFVLAELKNLKYINLVGCFGTRNNISELTKLKDMLPSDCVFSAGLPRKSKTNIDD